MTSELPTARVNLPTTPHDREFAWISIVDAYRRHAQPGSRLAVDPDRIVEGAKPLRLTKDFPLAPARWAAPPARGLGI